MITYLIFLILLFMIWLLLKLGFKNSEKNLDFLDRDHTDMLKGYAILGVLVGHVGQYLGINGIEYPAGVGVSLFLILSGYGVTLSESKNGLEGFWKKRLVKVYIPYILAVIIFLFITQTHLDLEEMVFGLTLIKPINPFGWYLRYIFVCYIVFYCAFRFIKNNRERQLAIFAVFTIWFIIRSTIFIDSVPFLQARQMVCFPIGIMIASLQVNKVQKFQGDQKIHFFAYSIILILIGTMIYGLEHTNYINNRKYTVNIV